MISFVYVRNLQWCSWVWFIHKVTQFFKKSLPFLCPTIKFKNIFCTFIMKSLSASEVTSCPNLVMGRYMIFFGQCLALQKLFMPFPSLSVVAIVL